MKRHGALYEKVYQFENVHDAYLKARRNKRYDPDVLKFTDRLEENLINIQNHLVWKSYRPGAYKKFKVYEPKERQIMALPFTDRVVQHALNTVIEPIFDSGFVYHSYACRNGKGAHKASRNLMHWLYDLHLAHGKDVYCLKGDVSKYFASIDHEVLKRLIRRKIKCPDTLWLIDLIIEHDGNDSDVGIPVGNLTSQIFANLYLHELDAYVKEGLGVRHYMRYMDDFVILSDSKDYLHRALTEVERFLHDELRLKLNPKTCIYNVRQGVDFVGYRHWHTHKLIRKSSIRRVTQRIRRFTRLYAEGRISFADVDKSMQSWLGHIRHADTYRIRNKILDGIVLRRNPG